MPRTRSQAVASPLVSLDTPRRKRKTAAPTANPTSTDTQEAKITKLKRGRKPANKEVNIATEKAPEDISQTKCIVSTSEEKENAHRSEKEAQEKVRIAQEAEEQRIKSPPKPKTELSAKQKGKKRARESHDDEAHTDGTPRVRRRRITTSAGQTPSERRTSSRRRPTTTPRNKLPFAARKKRIQERTEGNGPPSIFQLEEAIAHHKAHEEIEEAARQATEAERLQSIGRAAMERYAVLGPIPEDLRNSFEVPMFDDGRQVADESQVPQPPQTPSSNNWGLDIRGFFNSVTGSVRRFVPHLRQVPDQAVAFAAGGGPTPAAPINGTAAPSGEVNGTEERAETMDLTYSLFPQRIEPPQIVSEPRSSADDSNTRVSDGVAPIAEETVQAITQSIEKSTTLATDKQSPLTQKTSQSITNDKPKDPDTQAEPENGHKKRKRAPSPDVIPNPPGCSYGMDLDYFTYSDDEFEEAEAEAVAAAAASIPTTTSTTQPAVSAPIARPPEKRIRFLSPEHESSSVQQETAANHTGSTRTYYQPSTPPGWARPTTTVYSGEMFKETRRRSQASHKLSQGPIFAPGPSPQKPPQKHPEQPSPQLAQPPVQQPTSEPAPERAQKPVQQPVAQQLSQETDQQQSTLGASGNAIPSQLSRDRSDSNTPAAIKPNIGNGAINLPPIQPISAASRGQAVNERSKPKTPSRLRKMNYPASSSPASQASPVQNSNEPNGQELMQVFGNDEHGRQAYDLYQSCPSGDLSRVQWPPFESLPDDNIQQRINSTPLSDAERQAIRNSFLQSFEQFEREIEQGDIRAADILEGLPV